MAKKISGAKIWRRRRAGAILIVGFLLAGGIFWRANFADFNFNFDFNENSAQNSQNNSKNNAQNSRENSPNNSNNSAQNSNENFANSSEKNENQPRALDEIEKLAVKGRAPKTGYARDEFGSGWKVWQKCDTRQKILARDLTNLVFDDDNCTVLSGILDDPYTGEKINFTRSAATSAEVQIDHVVALSNAWQTGAQNLPKAERENLANDDLELLASDGSANMQKSDGDAATWLPPNKSFRCEYIARQIAVKVKYNLWLTAAEKSAMLKILATCPDEKLPAP